MTFDISAYLDSQYLLRVSEVIWINILLSGDNALVIALACRSLPARQRFWGMVLGASVAVGMRIGFAAIVSTLMNFPYVKLIGGCALLWIAVSLLDTGRQGHDEGKIESSESLLRAIKTIAVADLIMSLDNVIAVAAAAGGDHSLLIFGLAISVPLIVAGATLTMVVLMRLPILVWAGAGLLGWIAGDVVVNDPILAEAADSSDVLGDFQHRKQEIAPFLGAVGVLVTGVARRWRAQQRAL
ncbi:MAG TPA: TerC family protein [Xanthobacteraceae bacterium]|nr:TerC family protein [Xanthobacteraceae bacterium]